MCSVYVGLVLDGRQHTIPEMLNGWAFNSRSDFLALSAITSLICGRVCGSNWYFNNVLTMHWLWSDDYPVVTPENIHVYVHVHSKSGFEKLHVRVFSGSYNVHDIHVVMDAHTHTHTQHTHTQHP